MKIKTNRGEVEFTAAMVRRGMSFYDAAGDATYLLVKDDHMRRRRRHPGRWGERARKKRDKRRVRAEERLLNEWVRRESQRKPVCDRFRAFRLAV